MSKCTNIQLSAVNLPLACMLCACGASEGTIIDGSLSGITLALTAPNASARCLEESVSNRVNGREERRAFPLTPGVEQTIELFGVPAGDVDLSAIVTDNMDGDSCTGNVTYRAEVQQLRLAPGEVAYLSQSFLAQGNIVLDGQFETDIIADACIPDSNVALGADVSLSDDGWGGGTAKADVTDGLTRYSDTWAHGLAFTGGPSGWAGQPCGTRQMTLDLGAERSFERAQIFHHGDYHIPAIDVLEYSSNGESWSTIDQTRSVREDLRTDTEAEYYGATPTEHVFAPVTARYVRYSFDNCQMLQPTSDSHGWIYEARLLTCVEE